MGTSSSSDDKQERVAAAIEAADPGSNHQAGVDGDDPSAADKAEDSERTSD